MQASFSHLQLRGKRVQGENSKCRIDICRSRRRQSDTSINYSWPSHQQGSLATEQIPLSNDFAKFPQNIPPQYYENVADDTRLGNPLQRMKRFSTGWLGVIVDYEGTIVDEQADLQEEIWRQLTYESGRKSALQWQYNRAAIMKNEQVISELLCLARDPMKVREIAHKKEDMMAKATVDSPQRPHIGIDKFLVQLKKYDVPVAIVTSGPESRVKAELTDLKLIDLVDCVVYSEDTARSRPDPDPYLYASMLIERPVERCVIVTRCNSSIEACREAGMKCVGVATKQPKYELASADTVISSVDQLTFMDFKKLFGQEEGRTPQPELQLDDSFQSESSPSSQDYY